MDLLENSITNIFRLCKFLCMAECCICIFTKFCLPKISYPSRSCAIRIIGLKFNNMSIYNLNAGHVIFMTVIILNKNNCVNNKSKAQESNEQMNIDTHSYHNVTKLYFEI